MEEIVKHIAKLARLEFSDEEMAGFVPQFARIVEFMEEIKQLDLEGMEPLTQLIDVENIFREDQVRPSVLTDEALENARLKNERFFMVPNVFSKGNE